MLLYVSEAGSETFRVATFNLQGYLDAPAAHWPLKSAESKAKIQESIRALKPDVLAVQEMGSLSALTELQAGLRREGLDLTYAEFVSGADTNIHLAVLSRFPIVARRPHIDDRFLLGGRRFRVSRGFAEVDIQVNPAYSLTLLTAHLKSRRQSFSADEAELRLEEARLLRQKADALLTAKPNLNLVVLGDFNDTPDGAPVRTIIGRGKATLVDTRPGERLGEVPSPSAPNDVAWTYYYSKSDTYSRIDFVLLSQGMAREWVTNETCVLSLPNWQLASDHRPLVATFQSQDQ